MDNIKRFETINDYNAFNNSETLHPLVSVINMSKAKPRQASNLYFGFYTIFLKEVNCGMERITTTTRKEPWYSLRRDKLLALIVSNRFMLSIPFFFYLFQNYRFIHLLFDEHTLISNNGR